MQPMIIAVRGWYGVCANRRTGNQYKSGHFKYPKYGNYVRLSGTVPIRLLLRPGTGLSRDGAVRKLIGLITRRPGVQIPLPLFAQAVGG